jgi:ribosomal-protein-alanine N-acetyltransferase
MSVNRDYSFSTRRLIVGEWHSISAQYDATTNLREDVAKLLTPTVTRSLPSAWQGVYTTERAAAWIHERDQEGTTLLVIERSSNDSIGFLILSADTPDELRIGYLLAESAWGKGLASELIEGFIGWCRISGIRSVKAGVAEDNVASQKVLTNNGFTSSEIKHATAELFFELHF